MIVLGSVTSCSTKDTHFVAGMYVCADEPYQQWWWEQNDHGYIASGYVGNMVFLTEATVAVIAWHATKTENALALGLKRSLWPCVYGETARLVHSGFFLIPFCHPCRMYER